MPRASTPLMMPQAHVVAICPSTRHWQLCTTLYSAHTFKSKTLHNDCKASTTPQAFDPTVETVGLVWFWHNLEPSDVTVLPTKNRKCHGGFENMSLWINYFILGFLHVFQAVSVSFKHFRQHKQIALKTKSHPNILFDSAKYSCPSKIS